ncbi:YbbR-like domain-containing protein [Bacillus piscicola]|uniref:CdaR family protein n=1 Tax=Bacillus piscicola TaxID=1632684 RepID=UPI001F08E926|nr:CdaR family protein [Bacillus piscicola]
MDRLFNNHWFVKFVSLIIAIMLYMMVNMNNVSNQPSMLPSNDQSTYTINDVEVKAYYDEEKYEVASMDLMVDVKLTGPQTSIMLFQLSRPAYEIYVDLEGLGEGEHSVQIQHRDFPADLKVALTPRFTTVDIQSLKTVSYPVKAELTNEQEAEEGYTFGGPKVTPEKVDIKASQAMHDRIDTVRTYVDVAGADGRIETNSKVIAYDAQGNELDVPIEPDKVSVEVPVTEPFKEVSINLLREGSMPDDLSIESLDLMQGEVTIFGPLDKIKDINTIEAVLDLSKIKKSGTVEIKLVPPDGAAKVKPEKVKVEIKVGKRKKTVLKDVPITIENFPEDYSFTIKRPEQGMADVSVSGSSALLENIEKDSVSLIADWEKREEADSEDSSSIPVTLTGPPEIKLESDIKEIELEWATEEQSVAENPENQES